MKKQDWRNTVRQCDFDWAPTDESAARLILMASAVCRQPEPDKPLFFRGIPIKTTRKIEAPR